METLNNRRPKAETSLYRISDCTDDDIIFVDDDFFKDNFEAWFDCSGHYLFVPGSACRVDTHEIINIYRFWN